MPSCGAAEAAVRAGSGLIASKASSSSSKSLKSPRALRFSGLPAAKGLPRPKLGGLPGVNLKRLSTLVGDTGLLASTEVSHGVASNDASDSSSLPLLVSLPVWMSVASLLAASVLPGVTSNTLSSLSAGDAALNAFANVLLGVAANDGIDSSSSLLLMSLPDQMTVALLFTESVLAGETGPACSTTVTHPAGHRYT